METKRIKLKDITPNTGQIPGLPANPRQWTRTELDRLKQSIEDTPELLDARGLIVYPYEGRYVIIGGNMRHAACKELKMTDAPCIVLDPDTPADKLREITIKDNGSFGEWDYDMLANEWDDSPLPEWGVPSWVTNDDDLMPDVPDEERESADYDNAKMLFQFKPEEFDFVSAKLSMIDANKENALLKLLGYGEDCERT